MPQAAKRNLAERVFYVVVRMVAGAVLVALCCLVCSIVLFAGFEVVMGSGHESVRPVGVFLQNVALGGGVLGIGFGFLTGVPSGMVLGTLFGIAAGFRSPDSRARQRRRVVAPWVWSFLGMIVGICVGVAIFNGLGLTSEEWRGRVLTLFVSNGALGAGSGGLILGLLSRPSRDENG